MSVQERYGPYGYGLRGRIVSATLEPPRVSAVEPIVLGRNETFTCTQVSSRN